MSIELDHFYLLASVGAPEADCLAALGLSEGPPNRHLGQGTACRRFYFANAYLELLWVENPEETQGDIARPMRLWERWSGRGAAACPFGVILRPARQGGLLPFPAWEHRPPYLPLSLALHVGVNAECIEEPLLLYLSAAHWQDPLPTRNWQGIEHKGGFKELTALRIYSPHGAILSEAMQAVVETGAVVIHPSTEYVAEVGFDGEHRGQRVDLRPALPLVMCW